MRWEIFRTFGKKKIIGKEMNREQAKEKEFKSRQVY